MISMAVVLVGLVCAAAAILLHEVARYGRSETQTQLVSTTRALGLVIDGELQRFEGILQLLADGRDVDQADWTHVARAPVSFSQDLTPGSLSGSAMASNS